MSKVIVVGDTFISVDTWRQAVEMMNLPEPVEVFFRMVSGRFSESNFSES